MTKKLSDYSVLSFDCYGTLIDWETGIWDALQPVIARNGAQAVDRGRALQAFAATESAQQADHPEMRYPDVLANVFDRLCSEFKFDAGTGMRDEFAESVAHWPAFPDTADALRLLKQRYRLVVLSNVHRAGFAASNKKLGVEFDAIYTAEDIGSYKPNLVNFEYMLEHLHADLAIEKTSILHTAQSLFHDHVPATEIALARAWIDRQGLSESDNWGATARVENRPQVDFIFPTLGALAAAVS